MTIPGRTGSQAPPGSGDIFWMNQAILLPASFSKFLVVVYPMVGIGDSSQRLAIHSDTTVYAFKDKQLTNASLRKSPHQQAYKRTPRET